MWPNPQKTADLVTLTEEILNRKLHFFCSVDRIFNDVSIGVQYFVAFEWPDFSLKWLVLVWFENAGTMFLKK